MYFFQVEEIAISKRWVDASRENKQDPACLSGKHVGVLEAIYVSEVCTC